jgi:hypothetical protein
MHDKHLAEQIRKNIIEFYNRPWDDRLTKRHFFKPVNTYNPGKNWIDELIERKAFPYPWDNARMEWIPETNVWVLKFDIYKPNTTTMKQNTEQRECTTSNLWLWERVLKFFNQDNITVPKELYEAVARTVKELQELHNTSGYPSCDQESNVKKMVVDESPFRTALQEFEKQEGYRRDAKLSMFKAAGDVVVRHADNALLKGDRDLLLKLLIDIYKDIEKD